MRQIHFLFVSFLMIACAKIDTETSSGSSGLPGASGENVVSVTVKTTYETDTADASPTTHKVCQITAASPVGTAASCTVEIPEAQLYYSKLHMTISANSSYCEFASFQHYYFRLSTAAAYTLPDGTSVDCSGADASASCYFGALLDKYSDVSNTATYFHPSESADMTFTYQAANTRRQDSDNYQWFLGGSDTYSPRNIWVVNDLVDLATAQTIAGGGSMDYAGGTNHWQDWGVVCKDKYNETKYRMTLYIVDINSDNDDFTTWE